MSRMAIFTLQYLAFFVLAVITVDTFGNERVGDSLADRKIELSLPVQPMENAIRALAVQSGIQVVFYSDVADGLESKPMIGAFDSFTTALNYLLAGTGLNYRFVNEHTVAIQATDSRLQSSLVLPALAQAPENQGRQAVQDQAVDEEQRQVVKENRKQKEKPLEEVVVIGTHIRGARTASPVFRFDKKDIELTGTATLQGFIETLPQNWGGGANEDSVGSNAAIQNFGNGSSVNLHGLGSESTLVLVNGRRFAPAGIKGSFVDISMIPLHAIERVEVLTDGASAIYGSDAIAGVVNIIMQDNYEGAETAVRFGSVTDGDLNEYRISQSLGKNWDEGHILLSYEYYRRDSLGAEDRNFAMVDLPRTLLPQQERHSFFANINHNLRDDLFLFADLLYSNRESEGSTNSINFRSGIAALESENKQLMASFGANYDINRNWRVKLIGGFSETNLDHDIKTLDPDFDSRFNDVTTDTWYIDALFDGPLTKLPGGELNLALGANYREESFERVDIVGIDRRTETAPPNREVQAVFGELFIPLVSQSNRIPMVEALELSLAARYEDYSDFGDDVVPKFGLRWEPISGIGFRGTWGESFKAPTLPDTVGVDSLLLLEFTGFPLSLVQEGIAPLAAEESTNWTAGFDFQPEWAPFSLSLTYSDIEYEGRINAPAFSLFEFINMPEQFGDLVVRNPSTELVNSVIESIPPENFFNFFGPFEPDDIVFFIDDRITNIAVEKQSVYDLTINYPLETELGQFDFSLSSTYIKTFDRAPTPFASFRDVRNILFAPIDLRARGSVAWQITDAFSTALFVNYQDDYRNVDPASTKIDSWTTVDLNVRYKFGDGLDGLEISLNSQNLFDKDPPFAPNPAAFDGTTGYDGTNANPLGRFISLDVMKRW